MIDYVLQIILQSPLTSSAGEGHVGMVDRDIAFDDVGLPIIPGRRLKGLWRDAYRDIVDAWHQILSTRPEDRTLWPETYRAVVEKWTSANESPILVEDLFGDVGQPPTDSNVYFHVGNAEVQEASILKPWLEHFQHAKILSSLHPEDVVQQFTTVRAQTAISRQTGSALENTFRLTRTLKVGLVFRAPVSFAKPPDEAVVNALTIGAAALQYIGTGRTRGLGKVHCCFICGLTEKVLNNNTLLPITMNRSTELTEISKDEETKPINEVEQSGIPVEHTQTSEDPTTDASCSNCETPTYLARYRLVLKTAAVIPMVDGDPNAVVSRQHVPGSSVWGAAAWHYLRQVGQPTDDEFRHAFLDGGLRFLTAYPEVQDETIPNKVPQRTLPVPHSIRQFKKNENLVDFLKTSPQDLTDRSTKRLDRRTALISQKRLKTLPVKMELNYHHARASKDRSIGRALGSDVDGGGAFFQYQALQAAQVFQGAILGSKDNLRKLKEEWLNEVTIIRIGRSKGAQYGETEFEWIGDIQQLNELTEWNGFAAPQALPDLSKRLVITTLSPLLTVNGFGHPEAIFPRAELAKVLQLNISDLKLSDSYTRTEMIGGYYSHLRLPRQQWPAIAAGSVFVFDVEKVPDKECLLKLEHKGLGLRKGEGYGRLAVNRQDKIELTYTKETRLDNPEHQSYPDPPDREMCQDVQLFLQGVVRKHCLVEIQQQAMTVAERIQNIPRNALLGQLRLFLQQDPPTAVKILKNLRKPAEQKLIKCRINTRRSGLSWLPETLYDLFEKVWTHPESLTQELIKKQVNKFVDDRFSDTRQVIINTLVENDSQEMGQVFLHHLLTSLRSESRKMEILRQ